MAPLTKRESQVEIAGRDIRKLRMLLTVSVEVDNVELDGSLV